MFKITQSVIRCPKSNPVMQNYLRYNNFASAPITVTIRNTENDVNSEQTIDSPKIVNTDVDTSKPSRGTKPPKIYGNLVSAAFASLKNDKLPNEIQTPFTDSRIGEAKTVSELLSISEGSGISRRHALKVVSVLADWSATGKISLSNFETDPRFIRLCKVLTKGNQNHRKSTLEIQSEDLSTILNVTADDEAAKLITSLSLPQMVKVLSTLSLKKRRSTPLLRSLAFNIARNSNILNLKESADVLYSVTVLNFLDENLMEKICADVRIGLKDDFKGSAVIGSILTSLGLMRYKDKEVLDTISKWLLINHGTCRSQDIFSYFITLATLNHCPSNAEEIYKVLIPQLKQSETNRYSTWLDVVWSLVILNQATSEHLSTVLNENFIKTVEEDGHTNISSKFKLLNIDSACELLIKDYKGPRLSTNSCIRNTTILRTKNKEIFVGSLQDSLNNLVNSQMYLKTNIDTGMGFYIDIELALDKKCNPLPLNKQKDSLNRIKVAMLGYDFHDMCRKGLEPTGINALSIRLLEAKGYRVLIVPYTEFHLKDKLVNRIKYLEAKLKSITQT